MPSPFLLSAAALLAALPAAHAWDHYVTVGKDGNKYDPQYVEAQVGDKIKFQFFPKNHTVTQSPFETPCTAQAYGIDSGFQPVADAYNTKWFEFEVKDHTPMWFYCQQGTHCSKDGMVFAVNPPTYGDKTFDAFQQLAKTQPQNKPEDKPWENKPWEEKKPEWEDKPYEEPKPDQNWGHGEEHYITVGKGGNKYDPPFIHAKIGDRVKLQFFPKNHTITQSPFETPCTAQPWGIDSGFKPVADEQSTQWFEFEVKEEKPLWFYCQQGTHCTKDGMVFAVNPPAYGDKTFDAFQALAKSGADGGAAPQYAASGSAAVVGAASSGDDSDSSSGFGKWAPIVIGLLGANLFVGLVLVILSVLGHIRKGGRESGNTRSLPTVYAPVREKESEAFMVPGGSYRDDTRPYSEQ